MKFYLIYKDHGLYDPVLDDQEPLYDYELEDLGRQSEPTEVVFQIQQFVEPSDLGSSLLDYGASPGTNNLSESRSLTASPFVTPTKPYRPFSTEPIVEVPPLEDPIILNPNYRDQFGKSPLLDNDPDYLINAHYKNGLGGEGRYKLPISEQYDPEGTRFKQSVEVVEKLLKYEKHVKSLSKDLEVVDVTKETKICDTVSKDVTKKESLTEDVKIKKKDVRISEESIRKDSRTTFREEVEEESIRKELQQIEKMRQEIDLEKIEETAQTIVEDSIERAVSVAEEIKKEIEEELSSSEVEKTSEKVISESKKKDVSKSVKIDKSQESAEIIDKSVAQKEVKEYVDRKMSREERMESQEEVSRKVSRKDIEESEISKKVSKKDDKADFETKSYISKEYQHEEIREEPRRKESSAQETFEGKFEKVTKTVTGGVKTDKTGAEQRAYTIGLQTIPNIRGVVHSSYHYDLLLRTFFIHLTDVMVALSRFILTQPIFNQLPGAQETFTKTQTYESGERDFKVKKSSEEVIEKVDKKAQEAKMKVETKRERRELVTPVPVKEVIQEKKAVSQKIEKDIKVESLQEKKVEKKEIVKPVAVKQEQKIEKAAEVKEMSVEVSEKKSSTGAQMAQRSEKRLSQEMTQKMDAVISEFQTIAVEEDVKKEMLQKNRRSRSRSQIEQEVMKESDPLEWLSKVDSRRTSQERTEMSKKEFSSSETIEKKSYVETRQETRQKKPKTPKQTYVAIVEAHVYTNKDAIFEEHLTDISETSSVQSAEEINTAFEAIETLSTENVALETAIQELETAKIVEETHELAKVTAQSSATVQKIEEIMHDSKEFVQEEYKKETAIQSSDIQQVLIQEMKDIVEPVVEIKEKKIEKVEKVAVDINESLSVAESTEVSIEESKSEFTNVEMKKETAIQSSDIQQVVIQEMKDIVEPVVEIKESKIEKVEKVAVDISESLSVAESTEVSIEESKSEFTNVEMKKETAIQSRDIQQVLIQEMKDIVEPVVEIKESKIEKVEKVAVDINESLAVAESTEVSIEESKSEFTNVEMKKETVAIVEEEERAVEKVVESKVEVMKPKPVEVTETVKVRRDKTPVRDEYAALKIIKTVPIDSTLSPEIIEVEDISELISKSVVSKTGTSNQLEIDASRQMIAKSYVSTEIGLAKSEAKRESVMDVSQVSQASSQVGVSSVKKELALSQKIASEETSLTAVDRKLALRTNLEKELEISSPPSTISTPTPSTVPPTPLTDEFVFKLTLPLPKSRSGTPVPRDSTLSPEDEDPHIVKKNLVPHIETTIEKVVYDPPLPTPPADRVQSPVYTKPVLNGGGVMGKNPVYMKPGLKGGAGKVRFPVYRKPGLFGGADKPEFSKEEIREIERKSSLLASAIDETIKSIEEYKEEVGIETKKEVKVQEYKEEKVTKSHQEYCSKEIKKESIQNGFEEIDTKIEEIMEQCDALAAINKVEANNTEETESKGVVTEVAEEETKNESIEIESKIENEAKEKTVKFEHDVEIVEVKNADDKTVETETKERSPETKTVEPETVIVKPAVEVKQTEDVEIAVQASNVSEIAAETKVETEVKVEEKPDPLLAFRPVVFDPDNIQKRGVQQVVIQEPPGTQEPRQSPYMTESGEPIGTIKGIVDGLDDPVMDEEVAKELGKPGISEEKIATLISGEAEMLREAHVMGLSRVLTSHMHRADDSSVDFQKIKPMIDSLKDSEVLKALNEEMARQKAEEKKKEEKRWTTFLQKPKRPVPKARYGYQGWTEDDQVVSEPYKVKIVKQAKPKVAPDYKPEDFETGPLPWEERAIADSSLPPVEPEEPILIPEVPEFFEAVDPLTESEVPDLEDTGIPLPPPREPTPQPIIEEPPSEPEPIIEEVNEEEVARTEEKEETGEEMENRLAEQLVRSVQSMVDPNASVDQQLAQMRAQLAALAQLPEVIQQSLELVSRQLSKMNKQEAHVQMSATREERQQYQEVEEVQYHNASEMQTIQEANENEASQNQAAQNEADKMTIVEVEDKKETGQQNMQQEQQNMQQQQQNMRTTTPVMTEEEMRTEKQRKEQARLEFESRQVKQHPTPRACKPKRVFGPLDPDEARAVVLPGGRRWRKTQDVYDEQRIAETLQAHSELLHGKTMGINFMKYEKPPITLDHLKHSEVYKLVHDMDQPPLKRVEMRTPVMSEADYRERCRSMTPSVEKKHQQIHQQFHP